MVDSDFNPFVLGGKEGIAEAEKPDEKIEAELCNKEDCGYRCLLNCPVKALKKDGTMDKAACAKYMFETLNPLRCGMCIINCPKPANLSNR